MSSYCYRCGSTKLVSDRALAGRLVCSICGSPYDSSKINQLNRNKFFSFSYPKFFLILISTIIIIILFNP